MKKSTQSPRGKLSREIAMCVCRGGGEESIYLDLEEEGNARWYPSFSGINIFLCNCYDLSFLNLIFIW